MPGEDDEIDEGTEGGDKWQGLRKVAEKVKEVKETLQDRLTEVEKRLTVLETKAEKVESAASEAGLDLDF